MATKKITHEGKLYDAQPVDIGSRNEPSSTYKLADGSTLEVRLVVLGVNRII